MDFWNTEENHEGEALPLLQRNLADSMSLYEAMEQPEKIKFFEIPGYPSTLLSVSDFTILFKGRYQFCVVGPKGGLGTIIMDNPINGFLCFSFQYDTLNKPTYKSSDLDHVRCWHAKE
jgi:hypothetical protein